MTDGITHKTIARQLDRAAARSSYPASPKQVWFLAGLIFKAGKDADDINCGCLNTQASLSGREASQWIDFYLNENNAAA